VKILALGALYLKDITQMICAQFSSKNRPKFTLISLDFGYFLSLNDQILTSNFFGQNFLFSKAPFGAIFGQNLAVFFTKRLVTLIALASMDFCQAELVCNGATFLSSQTF
jgi:hypothetical protein